MVGSGKSKVATINTLLGTYSYLSGVKFKKVCFQKESYCLQLLILTDAGVLWPSPYCLCQQVLSLQASNKNPLQSNLGLLAVYAGI